MAENITVRKQIKRGYEEQEEQAPFESKEFRAANRISLDVTYMFYAPGDGSIKRETVESLIPEVMKAHQMLKDKQGDIYDGGVPNMTVELPRRNTFNLGQLYYMGSDLLA